MRKTTRLREEPVYVCDLCGKESVYSEAIEKCERRHATAEHLQTGMRVGWVEYVPGSDHGHPTEWPENRSGLILQSNGHERVLVELDDASRVWVDVLALESTPSDDPETSE